MFVPLSDVFLKRRTYNGIYIQDKGIRVHFHIGRSPPDVGYAITNTRGELMVEPIPPHY